MADINADMLRVGEARAAENAKIDQTRLRKDFTHDFLSVNIPNLKSDL